MEDVCLNNPKFYWKTVEMLIKENNDSSINDIPTLIEEKDDYELFYVTDKKKLPA